MSLHPQRSVQSTLLMSVQVTLVPITLTSFSVPLSFLSSLLATCFWKARQQRQKKQNKRKKKITFTQNERRYGARGRFDLFVVILSSLTHIELLLHSAKYILHRSDYIIVQPENEGKEPMPWTEASESDHTNNKSKEGRGGEGEGEHVSRAKLI